MFQTVEMDLCCGVGIDSDHLKTECLNGFKVVLGSEFNRVCERSPSVVLSFRFIWDKLVQI